MKKSKSDSRPKAIVVVVTTFLLFSMQTFGQVSKENLYHAFEFKNAFDKGTRRLDGKVSSKYWQSKSKYKIRAKIDPENRILSGKASITYFNNSPDSLRQIVFQTYHDLYKAGAKKASTGEMDITDGVNVKKLVANGQEIDIEDRMQFYKRQNVNMIITKTPTPPNSTVDLEIEWEYEIPLKKFRRSGAIDSTSMFIGYWYPEIAVRDDISRWDWNVYDGGVEFYHDYSDFDIEIEAPENFVLWASVAPENADEIYPKTILKRLKKAHKTDQPTEIVAKKDLEKGLKMKSTVWKYKMNDSPDFCFALSDHYVWSACTYTDSVGSFFLNTAYNPEKKAFASVLEIEKASLKIFHTQFPKYPFPYEHFTVFQGLPGGGMEYPGMANDAVYSGEQYSQWLGKEVSDYEANFELTLHEMSHMYFPFMMGINEKNYTWMEEGWADFSDYFNPHRFEGGNRSRSYLSRMSIPPMMVNSATISSNHGTNSYVLSSLSYYSLYHLLGEKLFFKTLHGYMDRWKHKHPTPFDFMYSFNNISGQDLNWFWKKWYFDWGHPDVAITAFANNKITLENLGGRPIAFTVEYTFEDGTTEKEIVSPIIWKDSNVHVKEVSFSKTITKIELKTFGGSDVSAENSIWVKEKE